MRARLLFLPALVLIGIVPAISLRREQCARAALENEVDRLRHFVLDERSTDRSASDDAAWIARYEAATRDVESLVPAEGADARYWNWLGCSEPEGAAPATPWMWKPEHRGALETIVRVARPALDELVAVAHERDRIGPVHTRPSMLACRHHTNLLCAAAITADSRSTSMAILMDAFDVAACIDDGSPIAGFLIAMSAGEIGDAARALDDTRVDDDGVECALEERLLSCVDRRACAVRNATDAIGMVDRGIHRDMDAEDLRSLSVLVRDTGNEFESICARPSPALPVRPIPMAYSMIWRRRDLDERLISRLRFSTPLRCVPHSSG